MRNYKAFCIFLFSLVISQLRNLISISGHDHSAGSFDRAVNLELWDLIALHTDALLPAKRRRRDTDETDARAPTVSVVFWQEYQSRDRVKEREESERAERRREKEGRKKGRKGGERKKDTVDAAWTLRLRDHRLTLSFIMFIPQTGIVPVHDVRFFLSACARRARRRNTRETANRKRRYKFSSRTHVDT